jgi:hypothetical protein
LSAIATPLFAGSYKYEGIPWGSSPADVQTQLKAKGFQDASVTKDGSVVFTTTLASGSIEVNGRASFDEQGLSRIFVVYFPSANQALTLYDTILGSLTKAYGEPVVSVRKFQEPFTEGDGFEDTAIRTGKVSLTAGWGTEDGNHVKIGANTHQMRIGVALMYQAGAQE